MIVSNSTEGAELFALRRDALLDREHALGAIIVFGHGSALGSGSKSHGAFRFLSGWDGHESPSLLVFTKDRAHLLVGSPFMVPLAHQLRSDLTIHDVRPNDWGKLLSTLLPMEAVAGTVGFTELPLQIHQGMRAAGLGQTVALDDDVARLRLVKDEAQIGRHRDAAALCDLLFARFGQELAQRRPTWQIQLALEALARHNGAEYCRSWLTIAPEADYCRYWREETMRIPESGDQVLLGVALTVDGHWGHGIRMGSIGPQKPEHRALVEHVEAMLEAGLAALQPGFTLAGIEKSIEAQMRSRGVASAFPDLRRFRNGHGLGFSYEDPLLTDAFPQHFDRTARETAAPDISLAPGMLFEIHPNLFVPGIGGAALGEMVLVTAGDPECLLRFPRACMTWS